MHVQRRACNCFTIRNYEVVIKQIFVVCTQPSQNMCLALICKCLLVVLLVSLTGGKHHGPSIARSNVKSAESESRSKLKLPGRSIIVPSKKEALVTTATKTLRKMGSQLLKTAKTVSKSASLLNRDIKAYFSSDFEVILLRMTEPTDVKTSLADISRFMATTNTFIHNSDLMSESNTYRVTMRKLWAKIAEKDVRTALKALHLFHILLYDSKPRNATLYQKLIRKMCKQFDQKTQTKYFDVKVLLRSATGSPDDDTLVSFAQALFNYVLTRGKSYTAKFDELAVVGYKHKAKSVVSEVRNNF